MSPAALSLSAFLELAAACAPGVSPDTLAAIAHTESGFAPLAIGVNGPGGGARQPRTLAEAISTAEALIAAGRSVDLGLMQINNRNLRWLGLTVAEAFDPCRNVAAGARVLTSFSGYNTGSPTRGFANGYVAKVQASAARLAASERATPAAEPQPAQQRTEPPSLPESFDVWATPAPQPAAPPPPGDTEATPAGDASSRLIVELVR